LSTKQKTGPKASPRSSGRGPRDRFHPAGASRGAIASATIRASSFGWIDAHADDRIRPTAERHDAAGWMLALIDRALASVEPAGARIQPNPSVAAPAIHAALGFGAPESSTLLPAAIAVLPDEMLLGLIVPPALDTDSDPIRACGASVQYLSDWRTTSATGYRCA
jgi:hypothetical protein